MAGSLPLIMTYVINFGIPPLLFTQVLYGSFLYTSSVLIGFWWISVILLVILVYSSLYAGGERAAKAKAWWPLGFVALMIAYTIARIYSSNMTLMLRPGVWMEMFRTHPHGTILPHGDPTLVLRWLFMLAGSLTMGGLALIVMGTRQTYPVAVKAFMVRNGGWITALGAMLQTSLAFRVYQAQPVTVQTKLFETPLYHTLSMVWLGLAVGGILLGVLTLIRRGKTSVVLATVAAALALLLTATMVVYRDGIRDLTLLVNGYQVWDLKVVANWPVVTLFLGSFLIALLLLGWLILVAVKAKPIQEEVAP